MPLDLTLVFVLGLVSSLHCVQMCGPIVLAFSLPLPPGARLRANLGYNAGRILTYALLGAIAGATGGGISKLAGLASGARIFAGIAMIVAGLLMVAHLPTTGLVSIQTKAIGRRLLAPHKFTLGMSLGFLPCGLIYAALLKAVDTGSPMQGALTMLAFGAGTAIALLTLGAASAFVRFPRWSNRFAAACIVAAGVALVWRGIMNPVCHG